MASQHIEIKGNETRFADRYRRFIDDLTLIRNRAKDYLAIMDQAASGGDWAGLAALLGIESAANAQTIYNLHVAMESKLDSGAVDDFVSRLG